MSAVFNNVALLVTLVSLSFVTTVINVTVMACVVTERKLHTTPGMYMFSLAVADGLVGLLVMPAMCVYTVYGLWSLGSVMCTLWVCTDVVFCTSSTLHILLMAYDRFNALFHPIHYMNTHGKASYALKNIAGAWLLGCAVWLPGVLYYRAVTPEIENQCYFIPAPLYVMSVVADYLPLLLIVAIYAACVNRLRQRFRTIAAVQLNKIDAMVSTVGTVDCARTVGESSVCNAALQSGDTMREVSLAREQARHKRHMHSLRFLGAVITAYMLCWLPFCILWPIVAYCADCIPEKVYMYSYWSAYANSTINPMLYFAFQRDFRDAFRALLGRICHRG